MGDTGIVTRKVPIHFTRLIYSSNIPINAGANTSTKYHGMGIRVTPLIITHKKPFTELFFLEV
jgi:hypothetical protein